MKDLIKKILDSNDVRGVLIEFMGRGRNQGDLPGSGPGGYCVCPNCGYKEPHTTGEPCNKKKCPKCGAIMTKSLK